MMEIRKTGIAFEAGSTITRLVYRKTQGRSGKRNAFDVCGTVLGFKAGCFFVHFTSAGMANFVAQRYCVNVFNTNDPEGNIFAVSAQRPAGVQIV
jgi:hypothetical protein